MNITINFVLIFIAVLAFGLASFNVAVGRLNLIAIGLFAVTLTLFIPLLR